MKTVYKVILVVVAALVIRGLHTTPKSVYIQQFNTGSGARYFCTYEDKFTFMEYMREQSK